jgi:hypothetical protein
MMMIERLVVACSLLSSHVAVAYYLPGVNPLSFAEGDV